MVKKLLFALSLILFSETLICQHINVSSFRKLENDMSARVEAPKRDQNGDICAIIKVVTTQTGFAWEGDGLGIVSTESKVGEFWLYVPYGSKRLTIKHPQLGVLRDYLYTLPIDRATVYELVLITGRVETTVVEDDLGQWLVIVPEPADALIFINNESVKSGEYLTKLKPGKYDYRVEAPLFHSNAGIFEIKDSKVELAIKLKPAYGFMEINTLPEQGARVIIDGNSQTQLSPFKSGRMASGEYTVQIYKDMYKHTSQKVLIKDNETTLLNVTLPPNFAEVTINAPTGAAIKVNDNRVGVGTWTGRLNPSLYTISSSLDSHKDAIQNIEVQAGEIKIYNLNPTPIYGTFDVISTPVGASVFINGKSYGTTPVTVKNHLIGECNLKLTKQGYEDINKRIDVTQGSSSSINENMKALFVINTVQENKSDESISKPRVEDKKRTTDNVYTPTSNKFELEKKLKRHRTLQMVWGASAILSAGTGVYTMLKANTLYEEYTSISSGSQVNIREDIEKFDKIAPIAFGLAGVCSVNFIIQGVKKSKVKKSLNIRTAYINNGVGLVLTMNF